MLVAKGLFEPTVDFSEVALRREDEGDRTDTASSSDSATGCRALSVSRIGSMMGQMNRMRLLSFHVLTAMRRWGDPSRQGQTHDNQLKELVKL